jgi:hypothetical protein
MSWAGPKKSKRAAIMASWWVQINLEKRVCRVLPFGDERLYGPRGPATGVRQTEFM